MKILRLILGDQLSETISSLKDCNKKDDLIFLCEVMEESTYVKHHKKKIAFIFSAMRHFSNFLVKNGYKVLYTKLDDSDNAGSFRGEIQRAIKNHNITHIIVTEPGEYRVLEDFKSWEKTFGIKVEIRTDSRFLCSITDFSEWSKKRSQIRMEYFYREIRKRYNILMIDDKPIGKKWNFDTENRKKPSEDLQIPNPFINSPDNITQEVLNLVNTHFKNHFGDIKEFYFAVTRDQALKVLNLFINERLPEFGNYQDAMLEGQAWMFHAHISFYLNCGLLLPLECIRLAEDAYHKKKAPLNAVEGFIRQICGWREYIRGVYWLNMPSYKNKNFFNAKRKLPKFYWTANTKLNCIKQCVKETKKNAYAHHIQRLMVLGNFALLAGIHPNEVNEWFLIVYADAYEWVELPNVTGMALHADGGYLGSKPYAASGNYIHKMSNYCKNCHFDVTKKTGDNACPFNYLYWNFLDKNRALLEKNQRMGMIYKIYDKMTKEKKTIIQNDSKKFLEAIEQ